MSDIVDRLRKAEKELVVLNEPPEDEDVLRDAREEIERLQHELWEEREWK